MPAPLAKQKLAVLRAHQILEEVYPARIAQKKATEEGRDSHLAWLTDAIETLDRLDRGEDARPDLARGIIP